MDNFKIIYKILKVLETAMDCPSFDGADISADALHLNPYRWFCLMEMLCDSGYLCGCELKRGLGDTYCIAGKPRITLKGLEYLQDNSMMQKAKGALQDFKQATPFL